MPSLDDIRVSGQQATATSAPTISGLHPIISWDFEENIAAPAQFSFEIKIGTSSVNIETSSFSGSLVSESIPSSSNFYEYTTHGLQRGNTYYGQVKIKDPDSDETPWAGFSFTTNNLPFVTNFSLSPDSPSSSDDIELSYTYNDTDNHEESGTKIRWFKNNVSVPSYDDVCILPAAATGAGESWSVKIIPSDGLEFGSIVETSSVTVGSSTQTSFKSITILPKNANVDDVLKVEWELNDDEYISVSGSVSFEWYVNNMAVSSSNNQFMRLDTQVGDSVTVILSLLDSTGTSLDDASPSPIIIKEVDWHIFDLTVNELREAINIIDTTPILEWKISKSTASSNDIPNFFRAVITKTPSLGGAIFDTEDIQYTKNSYSIPQGSLSRGQDYYVHVGISDVSPIPTANFINKPVKLAGSSWEENVSNSQGWTIETKLHPNDGMIFDPTTGLVIPEPPLDPVTGNPIPDPVTGITSPIASAKLGVSIHDGSFFCTIMFEKTKVIFHSDTTLEAEYSGFNLTSPRTFRITGKNNDVKIFVDNNLLLDASSKFTNASNLKFIEYGDLDNKFINQGVVKFFRFSTIGAFGVGENLPNENVFHFFEVGKIEGGTIQDILDNRISWLPEDTDESSKIIEFKENSSEVQLPTVTTNFSPITSIYIDGQRNKYIGTANGINAIYGEKHDPDYEFLTSSTDVAITSEDFDRITTLSAENVALVEPDTKSGWFTLDTTFRTIGVADTSDGFLTGDPYDPYIFGVDSHAVHYYSQRTHGHAWYDNADNAKGWQISFGFQLENLEQDNFEDQNIDHQGFGVFINDGAYQEILFFYEDRIRLFFANVFVPIATTSPRLYRITGKGKNLSIYQKLDNSSITTYQLILDGSGLFSTPASVGGNSRKPKIVFDSFGLYHAVWHDDGNRRSQIFYSVFDGTNWSNPEIVAQSKFNLRNPVIEVDSFGRIWVAYEDTSWGQTEISVSVRDGAGWNSPIRVTNHRSNKSNPSITIDSFNNVHLVWQDNRNGPSQIFWAERQNNTHAWISSGQFGEDTVIMQQRDFNEGDDPYVDELIGAVEFRNPKIVHHHPRVWVVAEGHKTDHTSVIYRSFRDVVDETWSSIGVPVFASGGTFLANGTSSLSSPPNRNCVNPDISVNGTLGFIVIVWEDQTEPISQIWGSSYNTAGTEVVAPTQITSRVSNATNPAAGFVSEQCAIMFESDNSIFLANFDAGFFKFNGSATGGSDEEIQTTTNRQVANPALPNFVPANNFKLVYDFLKVSNTTLTSVEFPDYYLIGDATVYHAASSYPADLILTSTSSDSIVSNIDTKEFAFGDMAENLSIRAHWKDIQMYFGYDARPHTVGTFNSTTALEWPDNRISDIFVDTFGNIIAGTFRGLVYHNVFTGNTTNIGGALANKLISAVKWAKNGIWYVGIRRGSGDTTSLFFTQSAGSIWEPMSGASGVPSINAIDIDTKGNAVCATDDGVYILNANEPLVAKVVSIPDNASNLPGVNNIVRTIAVDDRDVIWAGGDWGIVRIEGISVLGFSKKDGMRSSHVTDITIVNNYLRYVATSNGVDRMHGTTFAPISTQNQNILNNNISKIEYHAETNSLWIASLHSLHEIVFKDTAHEIIADEVVQYDSSEILTENSFNQTIYNILDLDTLSEDLFVTPESVNVLINKNKIDFGFTVSDSGEAVIFSTNLLTKDEVEVIISDKFSEFYDFNQTSIEKKVQGNKRTIIEKIAKTSTVNQFLFLAGGDKNQILHLANESNLPFTTILLDREEPIGVFEKMETLTPTQLRFKILAFDQHSGIDGYMLSNYVNFTSDGDTPLDFSELPNNGVVTHNIGSDLNNVFTSLSFPSSVNINGTTYTVDGNGSALAKWATNGVNPVLYAATSSPAIIWKLDATINADTTKTSAETWTAVAALGTDAATRDVIEMKTFLNVMYVATGSTSGGEGRVYKTTDGEIFEIAASVAAAPFNTIASAEAGGDGRVFFGDGLGQIHPYKGESVALADIITNIGDEVLSLAVYKNLLIASTGNQGRIYVINLDTNDSLPVFAGSETNINEVHIKDEFDDPQKSILYAGTSDSTTIYSSNLSDFDFVKSFSSFSKVINKIGTVDSSILDNPNPNVGDLQSVAIVGDSLYKHNEPAWEFFFLHDEIITDFIQHDSSGAPGIFIISDSKITKWTNQLTSKTVYLRLRDKAGNISAEPSTDVQCPKLDADGNVVSEDESCCNYAYSLKIADLKNFVNESRIVDITENGSVVFTYESPLPSKQSFYSADEIDQEIGVYTSEVLNGSNDLVTWKTISWSAETPTGTFVALQIRNGTTESATEVADWSVDLVPGSTGLVSIEHITDQYIQFRAILTSQTRDLSPTLSSVTLRNLTTQASHFFTTNFVLPSRPIKGLLTTNTFIPVTADIVFGINTKDSTDFGDYQTIEANRLFTTVQDQFGDNLRIGAKLLSPGVPQISATDDPGDPYDASSFTCSVDFVFQNSDTSSNNYHFRIKFYNDEFRTQLIHTFYSGNDQTGWSYGSGENNFPANGLTIAPSSTDTVSFEPLDSISANQKWFVTIEAYDGTFFETLSDNQSYICSSCNITNEDNLVSEYYKTGLPSGLTTIPQFSSFTPDFTLLENNISFVPISTDWVTTKGQTLSGYVDNFAARFRGKIQAPVAGVYTFELDSKDGSILFINAIEIISHDGAHGMDTPTTKKTGTVTLTTGFHDIEVQYFEGTGDGAGLNLKWIVPGESTAVLVPHQRFFHAVANEYCDDTDSPKILNFAVLFELENGETVKLNLSP